MKIGVLGAGVMGKGVTQRFAQFGYDVYLYDNNPDAIEVAETEIKKNIKIACMFQKTLKYNEVESKIHIIEEYDELADASFVVENVCEEIEIKKEVYEKLEEVCKKDCIIMANTSCIPITLLGSFTKRADKVIGVHFMNPVPLKDFSEVIKGRKTEQKTVDSVRMLLKDIGIEIEVIHDSAGFVSNRISHLFMNEAAFLVYEGIATPEQIDAIFKKGFDHTMGPLETADLIGLDTVLSSLQILYNEYEDPKFRACPLLKNMVYAGELGRKTGKGFYKY